MLTSATPGVAVASPGGDTDDRPVLGPPVELLEAPAGALHLRHADLGEQSRRVPAPTRGSPGEEVAGGDLARRRSGPARRRSRRAPAWWPADRRPGRRGRSSRRSCRGGGPAGRRHGWRRGRAAARARCSRSEVSTSRWRVSAPMAMWSPASRMYDRSVRRPMSTSTDGWARRSFISGSRLWPPARNLASSPCSPMRLIASSAEPAADVVECCGDHWRASFGGSACAGWRSTTLSGLAGIGTCDAETRQSASTTALITAGAAPIVPASPMPLTPSWLVGRRGDGVAEW